MEVRLLGGFAVDVNGHSVDAHDWRLRKAKTVIKLLALAPEQRLARDHVVDLLWPDRDPASAANNLHQVLHVARRALSAGNGSTPGSVTGLLELRDGTIELCAGGRAATDVHRFEELAERARVTANLADLRAAAAAYSGDLLPEDRYEDWAAGPRDELRRTHLAVLTALGEAALAADSVEEAGEVLERVLGADPVQERAVRALMRLLARTGRLSESLARYEQLRETLRSEYGTDPDPETRRLYQEQLTGSVEDDERHDAGERRRRHNLTEPITSFVGREREVAEVRRLLGRGRLVTLTGTGGVGKTRLAEEVAHSMVGDLVDGVWEVDLVPVAHHQLVADSVAAALGLDPAAGPDPSRTLVTRLASRTMLIVLDNCEHLLGECARLAALLVGQCPGVRLLATSREPLHVQGETTFRVPSLTLPAPADNDDPQQLTGSSSVRLFVDRVQAARPGFALDAGNAAAVTRICRGLDGVPLALELAAARSTHLQPVEIAEHLSDALSVLGRHTERTRHSTLRATLAWSHELLAEDERAMLRRLAVFSGSFTLEAAARVCAGPGLPGLSPAGLLDCLGRLVEKSLVQVEPTGGRSRYRLLETIRQFAHGHLRTAGEREAVAASHSLFYLELVQRNDPERAAGVVVERPQLLDAEHDNLRAAYDWALVHDPERALMLALCLWRFWLARGHFVEGGDRLERALGAAGGPSPERSRALLALAVLDLRRGTTHRVSSLGRQSVAVAEVACPPEEVRFARVLWGFLDWLRCDLDAATAAAGELLAHDGPTVPEARVTARWLLGMVALFRLDTAQGLEHLHAALDDVDAVDPACAPFLPAVTHCVAHVRFGGLMVPVFEETALLGRRVGRAQAPGYLLSAISGAHRLAGDLPAAHEAVRQALEVFAGLGDHAGQAVALNHLGGVERDLARYADAGRHLQQALRLHHERGDRRGENLVVSNLGLLAAAEGDVATGRRLAGRALRLAEETEDGPGMVGALLNLAVVEVFGGDLSTAGHLAARSVDAVRGQGYPSLEAWGCLLVAMLLGANGDGAGASAYARTASTTFSRMGCRMGLEQLGLLRDAKEMLRARS